MAPSAAPYLALLLLGTVAHCCAQQTAATYVPSWAPFWARPLYSAQLQLELAEMQRDDQKGGVELIVLGDSMTEVLRGTMLSLPCNETELRLDCTRLSGVFKRQFGQHSFSVQSVAGDRVESLIWRMEHGSLPTLHTPKVVVMMIGTNDLHNIAIDNWDGVLAPGVLERLLADAAPIVARRMKVALRVFRQRLPNTHLVLMALLPRGSDRVKPQDNNSNWRWPSVYTQGLTIVNQRLRAFAAAQPLTHFLDCGRPFFTHGGTQLDTTLLPDGMHFSATGLERALGPCLKPVVDALMRR